MVVDAIEILAEPLTVDAADDSTAVAPEAPIVLEEPVEDVAASEPALTLAEALRQTAAYNLNALSTACLVSLLGIASWLLDPAGEPPELLASDEDAVVIDRALHALIALQDAFPDADLADEDRAVTADDPDELEDDADGDEPDFTG